MLIDRLRKSPVGSDETARLIDWAIVSRRSIRSFFPTPVPREEIEAVLNVARYSATGVNLQPWNVHVVTGDMKARLSAAITEVDDHPADDQRFSDPYAYYPREWTSPYIERRREVGWGLYSLLGISRSDKQRMHEQHGRNYRFFGAPVGLFFTIDRVLQEGSLLDYGMFLQSLMIAARGRGLHTCPQAAFLKYHSIITEMLAIPKSQMLVCGMSLGYADDGSIENTLVTGREPVRAFTTFHSE
ncbi:nitroreductase [Pseudomonas putida TRO1]|uniref:Nitroreductase n=1 Tax=Pseudomonas putida TRO1 TaxID=1227924 RepID=A0AAD2W560_PSEPU|nr:MULTISPECIES: nitroreductase family protein [Pseudomonas]ELS0922587.1 nitroreductase [Pseudomonas putida]ENY74299.1 nitroreductase [Pseudomonas putida TRO1]UWH25006.1 nitroreductase [Pseudomonas sp. HD6515]HDS0938274.1 nitroreductase [Pseudomonas putida]